MIKISDDLERDLKLVRFMIEEDQSNETLKFLIEYLLGQIEKLKK